ncbi:unnamed protein product [Gulo gulo]|uniref:Kinesin motor domain-containing protein n=1 Tax=Gulo gulo TaxID=48420 RepID=A0A9X9LD35_GULGU|nr:unnamed protein product [Gulo gulo]
MLGMDAEPGIYLRTLTDLFRAIEETRDHADCSVSMSYLEIYNEVIRDLLNPSSGFLDLREDSRGNIQIAGIMEVSTSNAQEVRVTGAHRGKGALASAATLSRAHGAEPDTRPHVVSWLTGWQTVRSGQTLLTTVPSAPRCGRGARSHVAPQPVPDSLKSPTCSVVPVPPGTQWAPHRG